MDEEDRYSASSAESDRENEPDEVMEDADDGDNDNDAEPDAEGEAEGEDYADEDNNEDEDNDEGDNEGAGDQDDAAVSESQNTSTDDKMAEKLRLKSNTPQPVPSSLKWRPNLRPEALNARLYDIVPTMAAPMSTSINAMAITPDLRYWITGGADGYIRKYDGPGTINGKLALTVAQRHPFVDSVTKAGILMSYWENEEPPPPGRGDQEHTLSPVYSLAVHSEALWLLSGLESGAINLQSVRHDEGKRIACLQKHTNAVSVLTLAQDEKSVLSGAWDKNIFDWDLNTGQIKRSFDGNAGQISSIELRPARGDPIPAYADEPLPPNTMATNNGAPTLNGGFTDSINGGRPSELNRTTSFGARDGEGEASPAHESLFGGSDAGSLFGETAGEQPFGHDDDEFGAAMNMMPGHDGGMDHSADMAMAGMEGMEMGKESVPAVQPPSGDDAMDIDPSAVPGPEDNQASSSAPAPALEPADVSVSGTAEASQSVQSQGVGTQPDQPTQEQSTFNDASIKRSQSPIIISSQPPPILHDPTQTSSTTFLSSAIDGTIRIWDRRVPNPVARINNRVGVPPWCMSACWSPDGNRIYAGRRNGTVEEFDIAKARRGWEPERVLKFPAGSGAVSAVRPMVNGRHLVCASHDILRLYDLRDTRAFKHSTVPFLIIPGPPRAGVISSLYIDPSSRFMLSAAGTRGWDGTCTEVLIGYEINVVES